MSRYRFSPAAERDLEEIVDYIAADDGAAAARIVDAIEVACRAIGEYPAIGRRRDEIASGVMSFPVGRYVIFYRPEPRPVGIVRVLHGSRDLEAVFRSE